MICKTEQQLDDIRRTSFIKGYACGIISIAGFIVVLELMFSVTTRVIATL